MIVGVTIGDERLACKVALDDAAQTKGLQESRPLLQDEGMVFVWPNAREAAFHMGRVRFPIDIAFVGRDGRVACVERGEPGFRGRWAHEASMVIETNAGRLAHLVGAPVHLLGRTAQQTYNLLKTITDSAGAGSYYGGEQEHFRPRMEKQEPPNFEDRRLVDDKGIAEDGPMPNWVDNEGYHRPFDTALVGPVRSAALEIIPEKFVPLVVDAAAQVGIPWERTPLNQHIEQAVIDQRTLGRWLSVLPLSMADRLTALQAASSPEGLDAIGAGFIAAGMADLARVVRDVALELTRTRGGLK